MLVGINWTDLKGQDGSLDTETSFVKDSLIAGNYYTFRARAYNVHGWGEYSDEYAL